MTVNEAIKKLENFVDGFSEYPDLNVVGWDDLEAMETLIEFAKEQFNNVTTSFKIGRHWEE